MMTRIADTALNEYELVTGLEIHIQLNTDTKIFSSDQAGFTDDPNTHISYVSLGLPGTLPYLNRQVVENAVRMGLATGCRINTGNYFERKNYFYADLPKGYQITQDKLPVCEEGFLDITTKAGGRRIRINRIHMEDDAGKSIHDLDEEYSLIDLNRAGTPLLELVTEPDIRSAEEAAAFFTEIRRIGMYLDITDGNLEEGSMRCDANISVRKKGSTGYGNRCEVKNINSVRNLQRAIAYEFRRQVEVLESGGSIEQNTLGFDANTGITSPQRSKEMANDYRYFPEPDLPPVQISQDYIDRLKQELPELPAAKRERYCRELGLSEYDAGVLTAEKETASYFEQLLKEGAAAKSAANWVIGPLKEQASYPGVQAMAGMIGLVDSGKINFSSAAQILLPGLLVNTQETALQIAEKMDLLIDTPSGDLEEVIDRVLDLYRDKVNEYRKGKKGLLGLFMGEVMKQTGGKINPAETNKLLLTKLEKS